MILQHGQAAGQAVAGHWGAGRAPVHRVTLLGGFGVWSVDAQRVVGVGGLPRAVQRLVAIVSLSGRPARAAIAGELGPDVPEQHATGSLRSTLWRLQRSAPGLLDAGGGALCLSAGVQVDVLELSDWAERVRNPDTAIDDLTPSVALRGDLLPGWYDDWVLVEQERVRQLRLHALEAVAVRLTAAGRHSDALEAAYQAVRAEPLRESAHRTVVQVHLTEGNLVDALRAYDGCRERLSAGAGRAPIDVDAAAPARRS